MTINPFSDAKPFDSAALDVQSFLESLDISAMKLGLERVLLLLDTLGNPQEALPIVHIAGTNGKGSVTAMLSSILKSTHLTVGSFISPHLIHVRERISINGNPILPDDFYHEVSLLKRHLEELHWDRSIWPTYFEFLNVVAYQYFKRKGVNIAVFETGLGGRLDSTNVIRHPLLTVITGIGMDHTQHLGDTLEKIAFEKAGILKAGSPLALGANIPYNARNVILKKSAEMEITVDEAHPDLFRIDPDSRPQEGLSIYNDSNGRRYRLSLLGLYQKNNLALVWTCVNQLRRQGYTISEEAVQEGLLKTCWPVRFQYFPERKLILDGSHNEDGFQSLEESLSFYFNKTPVYWIISLRANRDPASLLDLIARFGKPLGLIVTQAQPNRLYHSPEILMEEARRRLSESCFIKKASSPLEALSLLNTMRRPAAISEDNPLTVVTGSLYTAGDCLHFLNQTESPAAEKN